MRHPLIYHAFKSKMLSCRRAVLLGDMTEEDAGIAYDVLHEQLNEQHGAEVVWEAYDDLEADLRLLEHMEKFDWLGPIAQVYGFCLPFFVDTQKLERTLRLMNDLMQLDAECLKNEPGDEN